ncbi:hypothetical protein D3C79_678070 [compost metagenome]
MIPVNVNSDSGMLNTVSGKEVQSVHVEPESVFMIGRNMHLGGCRYGTLTVLTVLARLLMQLKSGAHKGTFIRSNRGANGS